MLADKKTSFTLEQIISGSTILINKPYGWTSFDVVNKLRYQLKRKAGLKNLKVGHTGTLDPLATGLLMICVGKHTKQIPGMMGLDKTYSGTFFVGATTPSYDSETAVDMHYPIEHITKHEINLAKNQLTGKIMQVPPIFSAKKIGGNKAYDFARKGQDIVMPAVEVQVYEFSVCTIKLPEITFIISCSKGTYIRSIARDFGIALKSGAYLQALHREKIGDFSISDAFEIEEFLQKIN